jgi:hypothetical protein
VQVFFFIAMADDKYVCTLTAASLKVAEEELGEKASERLVAVQTLRDWALQQKWMKTPTGMLTIHDDGLVNGVTI